MIHEYLKTRCFQISPVLSLSLPILKHLRVHYYTTVTSQKTHWKKRKNISTIANHCLIKDCTKTFLSNFINFSLTPHSQSGILTVHDLEFQYKKIIDEVMESCVSYAESIMFQLGRAGALTLTLAWNVHCGKVCYSELDVVCNINKNFKVLFPLDVFQLK